MKWREKRYLIIDVKGLNIQLMMVFWKNWDYPEASFEVVLFLNRETSWHFKAFRITTTGKIFEWGVFGKVGSFVKTFDWKMSLLIELSLHLMHQRKVGKLLSVESSVNRFHKFGPTKWKSQRWLSPAPENCHWLLWFDMAVAFLVIPLALMSKWLAMRPDMNLIRAFIKYLRGHPDFQNFPKKKLEPWMKFLLFYVLHLSPTTSLRRDYHCHVKLVFRHLMP